MDIKKRIAFSAHDAVKPGLAAWAYANADTLRPHALTATGNTAHTLMAETGLRIECLKSGALGGDMELGARLADGGIDILILFADPLTRQPHDIDVAQLLRLATLTETAVALNEATADFLVRSDLFGRPYHRPRGPRALPATQKRIDVQRSGTA